MELVCETVCDDCGPGVIVNPDTVSVFKLNDDYSAFTLCPYCEQVIYIPIDGVFAVELSEKNVPVLNWNDIRVVDDE